jgi:hypothetical protein
MLPVRELVRIGEPDRAMTLLERSVRGGFHCPAALASDPWLDPLRAKPRFVHLVREAEAGHAKAAEAYIRAGGERLLGAGIG